MLSLVTAAACCALLGVAAAEPKVLSLDFRKEASPESLRKRSEVAHALIKGRSTVDMSLGNVSRIITHFACQEYL
jgi:hypothetical protein